MNGWWLRAGVAVLGVALGLLAIALPLWLDPTPSALYIVAHVAIGWSFVLAGTIAWARRPGNPVGWLMALAGVVWFGRDFYWSDAALPMHLSDLALWIFLALLGHLLIVFPHGRIRTRTERVLVWSAYALAVGGYLSSQLFFDRKAEGCGNCPHDLLLVYPNHTLHVIGDSGTSALGVVLALAILVFVLARWWLATPPARRALTPIVCVAPAAVFVAAATLARDDLDVPFPSAIDTLLDWGAFVDVAIPVAFLVGLLQARLHRPALGELVVELSELPAPDRVQAALARALGDPSLEVAYWLPDNARYVDQAGGTVVLPTDGERAVRVLAHDGETLAALVYDPSLNEDAAFVEAAGAAARLALANGRLQAELRAQLSEVRASRARIVEAGDAERRRLERDLHDGAQQRLLGAILALRIARGRHDPAEIEALLAEAEGELEGTLAELRALARGIHPAVLTEEGLAPALATLARRSSVPVELDVTGDRLPPTVEAAAYFVAAEALANAVKHARASCVGISALHVNGSLVLEIADDGVGGADETCGTGLVGLRDRVESLSGSLRVASTAGHGTQIHAEIPAG